MVEREGIKDGKEREKSWVTEKQVLKEEEG